MRVYLHLIGFPLKRVSSHQQLKILQKSQTGSSGITIIFFTRTIVTSDELLLMVANRLNARAQDFQLKLVLKHQNEYKRIIIVKGFSFGIYSGMLSENQSSLNFQIELQAISLIESNVKDDLDETGDCSNTVASSQANQTQESNNMHEIYHYSNQLFEYLKIDEIGLFINLIDLFLKKHKASELQIMLNIYQYQTGYTLLLAAIIYNKTEFLQYLIRRYGQYIDFNLKSIDGWLPFQLALATQNKQVMNLFLECYNLINLDINWRSDKGQVIFNLINSINMDLIQKIVKRFPIRFQDLHDQEKVNVYDYIWKHSRLTDHEKRNLIGIMHASHLQMYDFYRWDQLLYNACTKYVPGAPHKYVPKKQIIYNPNLKIISGEITKCKNPVIFSKYVFFSVNSYAGAIEQYEINSKLKLNNDKDKLDRYEKKYHLSFQEVESVQVIEQKEKSWFLKKEWYCFSIKEKRDNKLIFACNHQFTANQWVNEIKQAIDAWVKNEYKHQSSKISKNYIHISDVEYQPPQCVTKKLGSVKLIQIFSNRLSMCEPEPVRKQKSIQKQMPMIKSKSHYNTMNTQLSSQQIIEPSSSLKFKDFKMMKLLGEGSFGQVYLVQCLKNKKLYALKAFQKKKIILSKQTKFVVSEVNILKQIKHPFIITLYFTFQTPNYIYLGLQYCEGKDLARHMNQQMMFPEQQVKIYAAEITLAIQYLHSIGVIYRDLKPENIMLGKDGHVLLVDFGLSKKTENNFAKTFCGSPAYLSPQMLDKQGVGPQSDYFTLGVVIYEFIFGEPPFMSDNIHMLYENIQNGKIKYPRKVDDVTRSLIESLLQKDPKKRLGSRSIEDIKNHPYFSGLDWKKVYNKEVKPPSRELHDPDFEVEQQAELINIFHDDFDYSVENYKINRFKNFSFIRDEEFG